MDIPIDGIQVECPGCGKKLNIPHRPEQGDRVSCFKCVETYRLTDTSTGKIERE